MGALRPTTTTHAKDAANDLDYSPEQYEDFELLDPEDFSQTIIILHEIGGTLLNKFLKKLVL